MRRLTRSLRRSHGTRSATGAARSKTRNVDRQRTSQPFEHLEGDACPFLNMPLVRGTDAGLMDEAIGTAGIARGEAVSLCRIKPPHGTRRVPQWRCAALHARPRMMFTSDDRAAGRRGRPQANAL